MKTKLKTLAVTLLLSLTAFSQTDTAYQSRPISISTDSILCLPIGTARLIVIELLQFDQCVEVLTATEELLRLSEQKIETQQLIIKENQTQYEACREQVQALNEKVNIYDESNKRLTEKNRKLRNTNTALLATTGVMSAILATLLLIK
jgi:predicted RNase H-like nuclease (RuvC/YqgF family)